MKNFLKIFVGAFALSMLCLVFCSDVALAQDVAIAAPSFGELMLQKLTPALTELALALVAALILAWRVGLAPWIKSHMEAGLLRNAVEYANEMALKIATRIEQTTVANARAAYADGTIKKEEFQKILEGAKESALSELKALTIGKLLGAGLSNDHALTVAGNALESAVPVAKATVAAGKSANPTKSPA